MARENQGLQIALIVFVMLTIILSITTFLFVGQSADAKLEKEQALKDKQTAETSANTLLTKANRLAEIVGFANADEIGTIDEAFRADMEKYAANLDEASHNYRRVMEYLNSTLEQKSVSLATSQEDLQRQKDRAESIEAQKQAQIDQFKAQAEQAAADLAAERGKFKSDWQAANQKSDDLSVQLERSRDDKDAVESQAKQDLAALNTKLNKQIEVVRARTEQVNEMLRPTFEAGDGNIRWVSQRNNTVWINLGSADAVRRQMTFSVYPSSTNDINRANKKADIEVTDILGEHLAEARIVSDEISDPILPGDIIYTPVWAPGEQLHFALTDGLDIDGDGKGDEQVIRDLITMNNGVIDAELTYEDGKAVRAGKMSTQTRFLVIGDKHDEDTPSDLLTARGEMIDEAKTLGIPTMNLPDLLRQMGWKNQTPVVRYGSGFNPNDFLPKPPEGGNPATDANITFPGFEPRQPRPKSIY